MIFSNKKKLQTNDMLIVFLSSTIREEKKTKEFEERFKKKEKYILVNLKTRILCYNIS